MKKRRFHMTKVVALATGMAKFLFKSPLFPVLLVLCTVGFWAGTQARPEPGTVPFGDLFENLSVLSYRDAPSDSTARFVVELATHGRVFRQYDVDSRQFLEPVQGHDYRRSITGTRYPPLRVRGHVNRGFWFELPGAPMQTFHSEQFEELYRSSLEYFRPVTIAASALAVLSGYSTGYRMGIWGGSLSNPRVQDRVLATPDIGRSIAREAWRRVLLEPVLVGHENDATRFASVRGTQRIYTNFFRLALNDSDSFIPREAARLDSAGHRREARSMLAFARAVRRAAQDTCYLTSEDFTAIEEWASLLDRRGHWAEGAIPTPGEERMKYLGTLSWYGVAPASSGEGRIWVGPRVLVRTGDTEGFVADEIPLTPVGCPVAWREWLRDDGMNLSANAWTAQWMGDMKQFMPIVQVGRSIAQLFSGHPERTGAVRLARPDSPSPTSPAKSGDVAASGPLAARVGALPTIRPTMSSARSDSGRRDSLDSAREITMQRADSAAGIEFAAQGVDSAGRGVDSPGRPPNRSTVKGEHVGAPIGPTRE